MTIFTSEHSLLPRTETLQRQLKKEELGRRLAVRNFSVLPVQDRTPGLTRSLSNLDTKVPPSRHIPTKRHSSRRDLDMPDVIHWGLQRLVELLLKHRLKERILHQN